MQPRPRRPGAVAAPDDATLALLFQRAVRRGAGQRASSSAVSCALEPSLFGSIEAAGSINKETSRRTLAVTATHTLAQEVRETELVLHQGNHGPKSNNRSVGEPQRLNDDDGQMQEDLEAPVCRIPALQNLEELMNELYEVYDCSQYHRDDVEAEYEKQELSIQELQYAHALQQAVVMTLTQAALARYPTYNAPTSNKKDQDPLTLGEVRVWLLEIVVRPYALSRQLAFTLFLNLSISITSIALAAVPHNDATRRHSQANEQMQTRLFHVLVEMLSKAVVVVSSSLRDTKPNTPKAKSSNESSMNSEYEWVAQAVGCLLLFTKQGGRYRSDRLNALDPQIIRFFLREISKFSSPRDDKRTSRGVGDLEDQLVELLVFAMYAQEGDVVVNNDERSQPQFALSMAALEYFGGLDLLLFYFYNAHSLSTKRLLLLVFFDVTCHHQQQKTHMSQAKTNSAAHKELWSQFQDWDLAFHLTSTPSLFTASSSTRVVKKLYALASPELARVLSEKQVQQFVNQLRILIHVDEYFAQSLSLGNTIQLLHDQEKHNVTEVLLGKVTQLLRSNRVEDKFQAERWLAELVTYGASGSSSALASSASASNGNQDHMLLAQHAKDPLSESIIFTGADEDLENSTNDLVPRGSFANQNDADELEETCCFDEDANIRIAARTKFWELAKSPSPAHRESLVRTLSVFVKRKLGAKNWSGLVSIAREINICLNVVVQQRETNQRVLVPLLLLILEVCKREVSYKDRQKQKYDRKCGESERFARSDSDSLASRFVEGEIALDAMLLKEFIPDFFLHVLSELQLQLHPRQRCRRKCCGTSSTSPLVGDMIMCTALIVAAIHEGGNDKQMAKPHDTSILALLPLMEACDTRVAVCVVFVLLNSIAAKLVASTLKHRDCEQYMELLRDLHANAVEDDDEAPLTVSYLHAKALLARWVH